MDHKTPLAGKTTFSSRMKMAATVNNKLIHTTHPSYKRPPPPTTTTTTGAVTGATNNNLINNRMQPPKTTAKTGLPLKSYDASKKPSASSVAYSKSSTQPLASSTSSRIALSQSRLSNLVAPTTISRTSNCSNNTRESNHHYTVTNATTAGNRFGPGVSGGVPSFANSRSSSKVSSISSTNFNNNNLSRQTSMTSAQSTVKRPQAGASANNYIPDTNSIRKGLAKFSNPIECQRQFQALNSKLRQLNEINQSKEDQINRLQDQLTTSVNFGVGYATTVQYLARKLKLDSDLDLENECEQLKAKVQQLKHKEEQHDAKLESIVDDYKNHLQLENDLKNDLKKELSDTISAHCLEITKLKEAHQNELDDLIQSHSGIQTSLEEELSSLKGDLNSKSKELRDLKHEHDILVNDFNKLEESLTKDKDARVKYAQEKINQLQKDVDSLNIVLEMRTEKIHSLERDSLLLGEAYNELNVAKDNIKALGQQVESLTVALNNKREQYENLLADHEKVAQELKRERKERRRMTMRTEQLEYVLNESCVSENNITA